jgi:murein DD-endopeptidase MepM/ murein hydrolase activator NlpD
MPSVGDVYTTMSIDVGPLTAALDRAEKITAEWGKTFEKQVKQAGQSVSGLGQSINTSMVHGAKGTDQLRSVIGGLNTGLGQLGITLGAGAIIKYGIDAGKTANSLERTQATVGALSGSTERYDQVVALAIKGQQLYGGSMQANLDGLGSLVNLSNRSGVALKDLDNIMRRLALKDSAQGISGAGTALREALFSSGAEGLQSLAERFEIPKSAIAEMGREGISTAEKVRILDRALTDLGITNDVLTKQTKTTAQTYTVLGSAVSNARDDIGGVLSRAFEGLAGQSAGLLNIFQDTRTGLDQYVAASLRATGQSEEQIKITQRQVTVWAEWLGVIDRVSTALPGVDVKAATAGPTEQKLEELARAANSRAASAMEQEAQRELMRHGSLVSRMRAEAEDAQEYARLSNLYAEASYAASADAAADYEDAVNRVRDAEIARNKAQQDVTFLPGQRVADNAVLAGLGALDQARIAPFEQAVTSATTGLARHERALAEAEKGLRKYQTALDEANEDVRQQRDDIRDAEEAIASYAEAASDAESNVAAGRYQLAVAERGLRDYQTAVKTANDAVDTQVRAIADAVRDLAPYQTAIETAEAAVDEQGRAVAAANRALRDYDDAVQAAEGGLERQQAQFDEVKRGYDEITRAIQAQIDRKRELLGQPLIGDDQTREAMQALDDQAAQLELRLTRMQLAGVSDDELRGVEDQLDRVRLKQRELRLEAELGNDRRRRELADLADTAQEVSFDEVAEGLASANTEIERLAPFADISRKAVENEQVALDDVKAKLEAAKEARERQIEVIDTEKRRLDDLNVVLDDNRRAYELADKAIDPMRKDLETLKLRVDDASRALDAQNKLLDPLRVKLQLLEDKATDAAEAFRIQNEKIDPLRENLLLLEGKANDAATAFHNADKALTPLRDKVVEFKDRVSDTTYELGRQRDLIDPMVTKLGTIAKAYNDAALAADTFTRSAGLANGALNGRSLSGGTGSGGVDAQAINSILAGTGLAGEGTLIARLSQQYNVPAALALAMFKKEASFMSAGLSVQNRNPGNIRDPGGYYGGTPGAGNFRQYASREEGIEAYFKLLNREYRQFIDQGDWAGLVGRYAPASDNNNVELYARQLIEWMSRFAQQIMRPTGGRGSGGSITDLIEAIGGTELTQGYHTGMNNDGTMWGGIDIGAALGDEIHALTSGRVVQAGRSVDGGIYAVIEDNRTKLKTYYGHMREQLLQVGDVIDAGDVVGHVGMTGKTTGPHIHFQAWLNEELINPLTHLQELLSASFGTGSGPGGLAVDLPGLAGADRVIADMAAAQAATQDAWDSMFGGTSKVADTYDEALRAAVKLRDVTKATKTILETPVAGGVPAAIDESAKSTRSIADSIAKMEAAIANATNAAAMGAVQSNATGTQLGNAPSTLIGGPFDAPRLLAPAMREVVEISGQTGEDSVTAMADSILKGTPELSENWTESLRRLNPMTFYPWADDMFEWFRDIGREFGGMMSDGFTLGWAGNPPEIAVPTPAMPAVPDAPADKGSKAPLTVNFNAPVDRRAAAQGVNDALRAAGLI